MRVERGERESERERKKNKLKRRESVERHDKRQVKATCSTYCNIQYT